VAWVHERTIPTDRPPHPTFADRGVPHGSLRMYSRLFPKFHNENLKLKVLLWYHPSLCDSMHCQPLLKLIFTRLSINIMPLDVLFFLFRRISNNNMADAWKWGGSDINTTYFCTWIWCMVVDLGKIFNTCLGNSFTACKLFFNFWSGCDTYKAQELGMWKLIWKFVFKWFLSFTLIMQ
jgi:hypothetical protein